MDSFILFAENTKQDFFLISGGFILVSISAIMKQTLGNSFSMILNILGIIMLSFALVILASQINTFFSSNPQFFTNYQYDLYRKNIYAGIGVCLLLFILICYASYTMFINKSD